VIAAEDDRDPAGVVDAQRGLVEAVADRGNLLDVFLGRVSQLAHFRDRRHEIPLVDDREPQR